MRIKRTAIGVALAATVAIPFMAAPAQANRGLRGCIAAEFWNGLEATISCVPEAQQCIATEFWNGLEATLTCV